MHRDDQDDTRSAEAVSAHAADDGDERDDQIARVRHDLAVANNCGEDPLLHDRDQPPAS